VGRYDIFTWFHSGEYVPFKRVFVLPAGLTQGCRRFFHPQCARHLCSVDQKVGVYLLESNLPDDIRQAGGKWARSFRKRF